MLDLFMCLVYNFRRDRMDLGPKTGAFQIQIYTLTPKG